MTKTLNRTEWYNQNDDYPDRNDKSVVEVYEENNRYAEGALVEGSQEGLV